MLGCWVGRVRSVDRRCFLPLAPIRHRRLPRREFTTFDQYWRNRWEYGRAYVNRLISGVKVFTHLASSGRQNPEHEKQVRPQACRMRSSAVALQSGSADGQCSTLKEHEAPSSQLEGRWPPFHQPIFPTRSAGESRVGLALGTSKQRNLLSESHDVLWLAMARLVLSNCRQSYATRRPTAGDRDVET